MTIHDVLRGLIRGFPNTEENRRLALLAIDAHERGYASAEEYQAELDAQAAALASSAPAPTGETDAERANRLEAEVEQLRALQRAQTAAPAVERAAPVPTA